jgi:hypothetical protein
MRCQRERLIYRQARRNNHASATTLAIRFAEWLPLQTACPWMKDSGTYIVVMSCESVLASWYYETQLCECTNRRNVQVSVREVRLTLLRESQHWVLKCSSNLSRSLTLNMARISFTSMQHGISAATFDFYARMVLRRCHSSDCQFCNLFRIMKWI